MNLQEIMNWRYAAKKFDENKEIDENTIRDILEITGLSASSYGLQPYKFVVVKNQSLKDKLAEASYGQTNVANASHLVVFAARTDINKKFIEDFIKLTAEQRKTDAGKFTEFKNMLIKSFASKTDEAIFDWASKQAYLALGTFLIACAEKQIDACPIGGFVPEKYDKILDLKAYNLRSVVVAAAGYRHPEDKYQFFAKVRKPLDEMIIEINR